MEGANVAGILFDRKSDYCQIRASTCYGNAEFRRFALDEDFIQQFKIKHPGLYTLWYLLTDCGRSLYRVLVTSVLVILAFAAVYYQLGPGHFNIAYLEWEFFTLFYYSVVTFTSLGYEDIVPASQIAAAVVIVEVITGYLALGILIAILADRIARRS